MRSGEDQGRIVDRLASGSAARINQFAPEGGDPRWCTPPSPLLNADCKAPLLAWQNSCSRRQFGPVELSARKGCAYLQMISLRRENSLRGKFAHFTGLDLRGDDMPEGLTTALEFTPRLAERRVRVRQAMVLRVGMIDDGRRPSFCLVRNVSALGVQVKLFGRLIRGSEVRLHVGDEEPLAGRVMWIRGEVAGIRFHGSLETERMLRVTQKLPPARRRSSPRASTSARAILRTGGRTHLAELRDISTNGARVRMFKAVNFGPSVMLTLPDMPTIKTYARWVAGQELGLAFESPLSIEIIAKWLEGRIVVPSRN